MRMRSMQVGNRELDGSAIGELMWGVDTSFAEFYLSAQEMH